MPGPRIRKDSLGFLSWNRKKAIGMKCKPVSMTETYSYWWFFYLWKEIRTKILIYVKE